MDLKAELQGTYSMVSSNRISQLLRPTRIYSEIPGMLKCPELSKSILGFAHITGGGFPDNIKRMLPPEDKQNKQGLTYKLDFEIHNMFTYLKQYAKQHNIEDVDKVIELYKWIYKMSGMSMDQMMRTFNCGIGMVFVTDRELDLPKLKQLYGYNDFIPLGTIVQN